MDNDARRFRNEMSRQVGQNRGMQGRNNQESRQRRVDNTIQFPQKYTAQKGTAHKAKARRKNKKLNLKLASLLLAASIGIGGLTIAGRHGEQELNVTEIQKMGVTADELGINADTISMMEKYDEYFENFDPKSTNLTESEVINMIEDIRTLNTNVVREKMADLRGVNRENVTLSHFFDKGSEKYYTAVLIDGEKERYDNNYGIMGIGNEHTIPEELSYLVQQIDSYETLIDDVHTDSITKANAVKKLEKLYNEVSKVATKDFTMDSKGNVELKDYDNTKQVEKDAEKEEESR